MSDDGRHALTVIAFVGSVFSPYYAWSRRHGKPDPLDHCALNVALYGAAGKRWAMTERGNAAVHRSRPALAIGPSAMSWDGTVLTIDIDEVTVPWPSRIRGRVRLHPTALFEGAAVLDRGCLHRWRPLAPCARMEVELDHPSLRWSGSGYFDSNLGEAPLEDAFQGWDWSRARLANGDTAVLYDVNRHDGGHVSLALRFDASGGLQDFASPPSAALPRTGWNIARNTRSDDESPAVVLDTLEDTPFYARSLVSARLLGEPVMAVHESLSLDRFDSRLVQAMLPFRMPRRRR